MGRMQSYKRIQSWQQSCKCFCRQTSEFAIAALGLFILLPQIAIAGVLHFSSYILPTISYMPPENPFSRKFFVITLHRQKQTKRLSSASTALLSTPL
jgi:hypothetical protein